MFSLLGSILASPLDRIAASLERLCDLYSLDLDSRGITIPRKSSHPASPADDRVEVMYGPRPPKPEEEDETL